MALKVQDQSQEVLAMAAEWPIVESLLGGTSKMRLAGATYLPRWPNEEGTSHDTRVQTATLFPAMARTISVMTGKPFAKQLTLGDDVPKRIKAWCDDADQQGNNLHSFSADVMAEALGYGICGVLVDFPRVGPEVRTVADERSLGARPYLVFVRHAQILGWQSERIGGVMRLNQLRIAETTEQPDGPFGTKTVRRVRVLEPGSFEIWEEGEKGEYSLIEGGTTTLDVVPFVPFYGKKKGFMWGASPLIDLAYLNVKHWQSQSDQDTILHVARVPILAMIGADDSSALTVGASSAVKLPMGAEIKFVEHTGAAIEAGAKSLEALESQMITTGAELLVIKPGEQKSATQSNNEAEANKSDLQRIVESFEDSLDQVLQLMALWVKEQQGGHASLFKDFGAATLTDASAQLILALQQAGLITKETAIREQQRRGMLAADVDPELELAAVQEEGPALGQIGLDPLTGLPIEPEPELDPETGKPKPPAIPGRAPTQPPPEPGANAPAAPDLSPLVDAIAALIVKMDATPPQAPVQLDLSPIVEAIRTMPAPTVNVPAAADNTEALQAMVDAIKNMPAPVVNVPAGNVTVSPAPINVEAPTINLPGSGPADPPSPPQPAPSIARDIAFTFNEAGDIVGATMRPAADVEGGE